MDSQTHIELAVKIVEAVGGCSKTAIGSLFPQIDRNPPTLHRLYAHNVFKARSINRFGLKFLTKTNFTAQEKTTFEFERFQAESSRFQSYLEKIPATDEFTFSSEDELTSLVSFVSHLYLDTFNQPTQPFAPLNIYCSGQWELWKELGEFRLRLYTTDIIHSLRHDLFENPLWSAWKNLDSVALIQAMMSRMCDFSEGKISPNLTEQGLKAMGLPKADSFAVSKTVDLFREFEGVLYELHQKHLEVNAGPPKKSQEPLLAGGPG